MKKEPGIKMKFIRLFEGYKEDLDAEKKRHKEVIVEIEKKYQSGVAYCLTTLIDEFGFERLVIEGTDLNDEENIILYGLDADDEDSHTELTRNILDELKRANKKLKVEFGTQMYLFLYDVINGRNLNWILKNRKRGESYSIGLADYNYHGAYYNLTELAEFGILDDIIGQYMISEFVIRFVIE